MRTITCILLATTTSVFAQLPDGLIGFWPLNTDFTDASGNGLHGLANNAGALPTDNRAGSGNCAYRMVEGGFTTDPAPLLGTQPTGGLTISYWTRQSQGDSFGRVMLQPTGPSLPIILETWDAGRPGFGQPGNMITADSSQISFDGQWHLIVGVYDAGNWHLYYDVSLLRSDSSGSVLAYPGPAQLSVMGAWNTDFDDVRIYDHALNQFEIGYLYEEQPDCSIASGVAEALFGATSFGPNPTSGGLEIRFDAPVPMGTLVTVFDHSGRMVQQLTCGGTGVAVDLSREADGIYEVRIGPGGQGRTIRAVKE